MDYLKIQYHFNYLLVFLVSLFSPMTISAIENTNKDLEKILILKEKILPADQVFEFSASLENKKIIFNWEIEKNCYLYLDKFSFFLKGYKGYRHPVFPSGKILKDEYFGEVEVFFDQVRAFLDYSFEFPVEMIVTYQGCNQSGYCYTPIKKQVFITENAEISVY